MIPSSTRHAKQHAKARQRRRLTAQERLARDRRQALWTFVQVAGVEPTNNAAERSIRPGVLWRKGSFGTQSAQGDAGPASLLTIKQSDKFHCGKAVWT